MRLKKQREEKGLALADIEKSTKIGIRLLKNIESGDFGALPSGVFARNFIRQYCDAIGVDADPILEKIFEDEQRGRETESVQKEKSSYAGIVLFFIFLLILAAIWGIRSGWFTMGKGGEEHRALPSKAEISMAKKAVPPVKPSSQKPLAQDATLSGRGVGGEPGNSENRNGEKGRPGDVSPAVQSDSTRQTGLVVSRNSKPGSSEKIQKEKGYPIRFEADEKCWVHLKSPEKEVDFILMKGEMYTTTCLPPTVISIGNVGHLRVFVNNEKVLFPSGKRVVKDFLLLSPDRQNGI